MTEEKPFIGIYRSLYPYQPQQDPELVITENRELELEENELLYILEKGEDLWWKVKKKAPSDQEDGDIGLVPGNYLEECQPIYQVRTLYDYEQQSSEEISFNEGEILDVFDEDNENWVFARCRMSYGFAPSNYLEKITNNKTLSADNINGFQVNSNSSPSLTSNLHVSPNSLKKTDILKETRPSNLSQYESSLNQSYGNIGKGLEKTFFPKVSESSEVLDVYAVSNEPYSFDMHQNSSNESLKTWTVYEIDKRKRKRGILSLGNNNIAFSSESSKKPLQLWPITSIIRYSFEKKHVFIDISSGESSVSFDFHAGSSEAAAEICSVIRNLVNVLHSPPLKEITSTANASASYLNSEISVKEIGKVSYKNHESNDNNHGNNDNNNDNNDNNNNDNNDNNDNDNNDNNDNDNNGNNDSNDDANYFNHKQLQGKKGIVLYDFNACEEDELSVKANTYVSILDDSTSRDWWKVKHGNSEGLVPASYIKYHFQESKTLKKTGHTELQRLEKKNHVERKISKPQLDKIKTWTDRTGAFKVDAQFLGVFDNKIHLHKLNGVKISVPLSKMSIEDVLYVENITESSKNKQNTDVNSVSNNSKYCKAKSKSASNKYESCSALESKNNYDWFDFFLSSGVKYNLCQTYATNFESDNLTESNLLDLTSENMRTLGIREDDIIRITRYIREKYKFKDKPDIYESGLEMKKSKTQANSILMTNSFVSKKDELNSFTFSNGKLKNNIKSLKSRSPQTNDIVDKGLESKNKEFSSKIEETSVSGFDDDAWCIKSSDIQRLKSPNLPRSDFPDSQLNYVMKNLSLSTPPMNPTHAPPLLARISQKQVQQNIIPPIQPVSQIVPQSQHNTIEPFLTSFTNSTSNTSHIQPFYNYGVINTPTITSQQFFSSSVMQPIIPQLQHTFQPQARFGQKAKQISEDSTYINYPLSENQAHTVHNSFPFTQQNMTSSLNLQNSGYNSIVPEQTIVQRPFQAANNFHYSIPSQYDSYKQRSLFLQQNTQQPPNQFQQSSNQYQQPSYKHGVFQNNFISPQVLENIESNSSFSALSQPTNISTSFHQTLVFKPVQFGVPKSSQFDYSRRRANLAAATPENPFGLAVGLNRGHKTTPYITTTRISRRKGYLSKRVSFIREIIHEVAGFAPYERRLIELLRNSKDKRARRFAKKRLGTLGRAKNKIEKLTHFIAESRKMTGH
ncbi:hypothetical protein PMAC_001806 [Pneumocystis sp. 'macacae']|nr:hypothetical protein PMAC_001806 [Pneumocystis sp. 'macacae']